MFLIFELYSWKKGGKKSSANSWDVCSWLWIPIFLSSCVCGIGTYLGFKIQPHGSPVVFRTCLPCFIPVESTDTTFWVQLALFICGFSTCGFDSNVDAKPALGGFTELCSSLICDLLAPQKASQRSHERHSWFAGRPPAPIWLTTKIDISRNPGMDLLPRGRWSCVLVDLVCVVLSGG